VREWMEEYVPGWLLGLMDWPGYRLRGRCWAVGCGRPMLLHTPWRLYDCERIPMAVVLNTERYAELVDLDTDRPEPAATIVV
jgi:hypothetical protein